MVEQNSVARVQTVALTIIHRRPIGKNLGHTVRAAGPEWRLFTLRNLLRFTEHFAA